jgi:GNAT superfamily N-acetyltransferase
MSGQEQSIGEIVIRAVPAAEIIDLRHQVLRQGLPRNTAIFPGDEEPGAIHLAAFSGDTLIGCATLHRNSFDHQAAYQLRGMAVAPSHQRHGIGALLLAEAERRVISQGVNTLRANCRTPAVPFYRKHGWQIISAEFIIETAGPHFKMMKIIRAADTPA